MIIIVIAGSRKRQNQKSLFRPTNSFSPPSPASSSLNSPSTLIPTQKFQALPPTIIPKAEYGQTVVHFKNTQLDNPSLQLRVKSHPGIEIGDILECETKFYEIQDQFADGGLSTIYQAIEMTSNEIFIVKQSLKTEIL